MKFITVLVIAFSLMFTCVGCKSRHDQVPGIWKEPQTGGNCEFNTDNTYSQDNPNATGTWAFAGNKVHIRIIKVGDGSVDEYLAKSYKAVGKNLEDPAVIDQLDKERAVFGDAVYELNSDGNLLTPADPTKITSGPLSKTSDTPVK